MRDSPIPPRSRITGSQQPARWRVAGVAGEAGRVPVTVTPATGQKIEGTLVRLDDFYVVVELADGTQRTFRRAGNDPVVDVRDPLEPHINMLPPYTDRHIHNVTAYLATLK